MNESFISYAREDWDTAEKIIKALNERDIDPWYDQEDIPAAVKWDPEMLVGVQCSQSFIYLISPDSLLSENCDKELNCALRHNKRLIPIVARSPESLPIHPAISELNWIFLNNFESAIDKLVTIIENPLEYHLLLNNRQQCFIEVHCQENEPPGKVVPLLRNNYMIGRHVFADMKNFGVISIKDKSKFISRNHLSLHWNHKQSGWRYQDLSLNGIAIFPKVKPEDILINNARIFLSSSCYLLFKALNPQTEEEYKGDNTPTLGAD